MPTPIFSGDPPVTIHIEPPAVITVSQVPGVGPVGPTGPAGHSFLPLSIPGLLAVAVGDIPITATRDTTIFGAWASCGEEPLGADVIFDILIEGVSIYTTPGNRPTVPAGTQTGTILAVPDVTDWLQGEQLTVNVVQVGNVFAGARAVVMLDCQ